MVETLPYAEIRNNLQTGDLVFFSGKGVVSEIIKFGTFSKWSHVGMVVVDDAFDLVCIWESTTLSNVEDLFEGKCIQGVQVASLSERIARYGGEVGFRRLGIPQRCENYREVIRNLRHEVNGKPYEESNLQLIMSALPNGFWDYNDETDLSSLFCSELCAEALIRLGLLPSDSASLNFSPAELARYDFN